MMRRTPAATLGLLILAQCVSAGEMRLAAPPQFSPRVERFARQEISFEIEGPVANPYDPAEVSVVCDLTTPSGARIRVPAFWYRRFDAVRNTPEDQEGWRVRLTPLEEGQYVATLGLSRRGAPVEALGQIRFTCVGSGRTGFVGARDGRLVVSTGGNFLALGANRCWGDVRRTEAYLDDLALLASHGATVVRVWLAPWWLPVERERGVYDQAACARLDAIFDEAERLGLRIILCIEQHGNLEPAGGEVARWPEHPYNASNGGPCRSVRDFFSRAEARRLFRNRLRYLAARYGYSTALLAWEIFNEVEYVPLEHGGFAWNEWLVEDWHSEMSEYLRGEDAHGHLISTSSDPSLQFRLAADGAVDLVQLHVYAEKDLPDSVVREVSRARSETRLPVIVGEFGLRGTEMSPDDVSRCLFAATLSGAAGALPWIQDERDMTRYLERIQAARQFFDDDFVRAGPVEKAEVRPRKAVPGFTSVLGLRAGGDMWLLAPRGTPLELEAAVSARGEYSVEYWNPFAGVIVRRSRVTADDAALVVPLADAGEEVALKISWLRPEDR